MKVHFKERLAELMEPLAAAIILDAMENPSLLQQREGDLTWYESNPQKYRKNFNAHFPIHRRGEGTVDRILILCDENMEGAYGVEAIRREDYQVDNYYHNIVALYVNVGDPYSTTVVYDTEEEEFFICGYGDWVEGYKEENPDAIL